MAEFSGTPFGEGRRVAVVASRFNETITQQLVDGALDALLKHGVALDDIDVIRVPGAWELPLAVRRAILTERYDVLVALGAIIRGGTPHFEYVAGETSRALMDASIDGDIPVGLGLLTCDDMAQAEARAGGLHGNKGWEAALAALEAADVLDQIEPAAGDHDPDDADTESVNAG